MAHLDRGKIVRTIETLRGSCGAEPAVDCRLAVSDFVVDSIRQPDADAEHAYAVGTWW